MPSKEMMLHSGGSLKHVEITYDWDIDRDIIEIYKVWDIVNKREMSLTEKQAAQVIAEIKD